MKQTKSSGIELLRITAALMVFLLHFNGSYAAAHFEAIENYTGRLVISFFTCACICAVDLFMIISGYFLYRRDSRSVEKVIRLIVEVILVKVIFSFVYSLFTDFRLTWDCLVPNNYFVIFYCAVYLISPIINAGLRQWKNTRLILTLCLILFSLWPTVADILTDTLGWRDISTVTRGGLTGGYDIVNFMLMYIVGACIGREREYFRKIPLWVPAAAAAVSVAIMFVCVEKLSFGGILRAYSSPLVILEAVSLFLIFERIPMGSVPAVNSLSAASFTMYLAQYYFFPLIQGFVLRDSVALSCVLIALGGIGIYLCVWLFHLVYDKLINRMLLGKLLHFPSLF